MYRRIFCCLLCTILFLSVLPAQAAQSDFTTAEFRSGVCITKYTGSDRAVTIPSTLNGKPVVGIDNAAFSGNETITSLTIPESVTFIGIPGNPEEYSAELPHFTESPNLAEIQVASDNPAFCSADGVLFSKDGTELLQYPCAASRTSYTVPTGVYTITETSFQNAVQLQSIRFPSTLNTIADCAFERCTALQSAELPLSVTAVGSSAFRFCNAMTEIRIVNPRCTISMTSATLPTGAAICGYDSSTAQDYAKTNARTFVSLGAFDKKTCTHPSYDVKEIKAATCTETGILQHTCTTCGYSYQTQIEKNSANHNPKAIPDLAATCTESGHSGGTVCSRCGKQLTAPKVIPALGHTVKTTTTKATAKADGSITKTCTRCGELLSRTTIPYPKTITLSNTVFTYSGKAKNPKAAVKGSDGKTIASSNYKVTLPAARTKVGKYTLKIAFTGSQYSGTVSKTFTIKPAATGIVRLTAKRKGFAVKWKKKTAQTTGYQVQYCTKKSFPSASRKTKRITKKSTVSKSISGLSTRKTYYVRVRTYQTVKSGGTSATYYSSWSKVKKVRTK